MRSELARNPAHQKIVFLGTALCRTFPGGNLGYRGNYRGEAPSNGSHRNFRMRDLGIAR